MKLLKPKYHNRRSVSYLSWKANNDRLLELDKMLKKQSVVLRKVTEKVDRITCYFDDVFVEWKPAFSFLRSQMIDSTFNLSDFKEPDFKFLLPLFNEAQNTWYKKYEPAWQINSPIGLSVDHAFPKRLEGDVCTANGLNSLPVQKDLCTVNVGDLLNTVISLKIPPAPKEEPTPQEQQREFLFILKDILQREKVELDKKLSGHRVRVFISLALDLIDRIRIFLRLFRIPTHDGKDEDSVHIEINRRVNNFFSLKIPPWRKIIMSAR